MCRTRQHNDLSNDLYIFVVYVTNINNILFPKRSAVDTKIVYLRIANAGAESETEIITLFPQNSVLFHMTPMKVSLMLHFLIWTSAWHVLHFLEFQIFLCFIVLNIAAEANNCLYMHIFDGFYYV